MRLEIIPIESSGVFEVLDWDKQEPYLDGFKYHEDAELFVKAKEESEQRQSRSA